MKDVVIRRRRIMVLLVTVLVVSTMSESMVMPASAEEPFVDDDDSPHNEAIEYLADHGVIRGCNPPANDRFCPTRPVTRGEMATFLARALDLPPGAKRNFADTADSPHLASIDSLASTGISRGCNPPSNDRFCPDEAVTRGSMAAFLGRALDLESGGDFFSDDDSSIFEADIDAIAGVGLSRGCNPPLNTMFCPDRPVDRGEMATFIKRAMEIEVTGIVPGIPPPPPPGRCVGVPFEGPNDPQGDVFVPPGESIQAAVDSNPEETTFILGAGVHTRQTVSPKHRTRFIGQPGAVLDGDGVTEYAFGGPGDHVLIEGLEIRGYVSSRTEGVVRSVNSSLDWTVRANEIHHNQGQGVTFVAGWKVVGNHLHHNEVYGVSGMGPGVEVSFNEISHNNPDGTVNPYHGAGGSKFIRTEGLVVRGNCSHHNQGPGLWTDGFNVGTLYEGNVVFANAHAGIKHEISCAAAIRSNAVSDNGFDNPHWLEGAGIVVLNSPDVTVVGNVVRDNADGIGGIQGDRALKTSDECELSLKNLHVAGNVIAMTEGETGIVTNETSAVWESWGNRFSGNTYELAGDGGRFFAWESEHLTLAEWKSVGQG